MLTEALRHQEAGWQVVLIGDINIARSSLDGYPGIRLGAEHVRNRKEWNELFIESEEGLRGVDSVSKEYSNYLSYLSRYSLSIE
jgi:hypothetical protein